MKSFPLTSGKPQSLPKSSLSSQNNKEPLPPKRSKKQKKSQNCDGKSLLIILYFILIEIIYIMAYHDNKYAYLTPDRKPVPDTPFKGLSTTDAKQIYTKYNPLASPF